MTFIMDGTNNFTTLKMMWRIIFFYWVIQSYFNEILEGIHDINHHLDHKMFKHEMVFETKI